MVRACVVVNISEGGGGVGMVEREFRLPGSPYEELVNIIVAYGTRDEAVGAGGVGKLDSVHQSSVSRNNAFLTEIGVLQGESKKLITRRGRSLALALAHKDGAGIKDNWRAIVAASEFLQNVVSAVELVATFEKRPEVLVPEEDPTAQTPETRESVVTVGEFNGTPAGNSPTVSIHVQIRCTAEEIDDLAPRLKSLLRELSTEP